MSYLDRLMDRLAAKVVGKIYIPPSHQTIKCGLYVGGKTTTTITHSSFTSGGEVTDETLPYGQDYNNTEPAWDGKIWYPLGGKND